MISITSIKEDMGTVRGCAQIPYRGFIISMSTMDRSTGLRIFEGEIGERRADDSDVTGEIFGSETDALITLDHIMLAKAWIDIRIRNRELMNQRAKELRDG